MLKLNGVYRRPRLDLPVILNGDNACKKTYRAHGRENLVLLCVTLMCPANWADIIFCKNYRVIRVHVTGKDIFCLSLD